MSCDLVDLVIEEPAWRDALPDLPEVAARSAHAALTGAGLSPDDYVVCLLACDDTRIAALNDAHRGHKRPTNVLSWPAYDLAPEAPGHRPEAPPSPVEQGQIALGDVAIALQTTQAEAEHASTPLKTHATHLILHGCLHLLGFDHQTESDAVLMEGLEARLLEQMGLPDPYLSAH